MAERFVGESISVQDGDGVLGPTRFTWRDSDYEVAAVETAWQDRSQPSVAAHPNWRTRRHRNYFDVRCVSGERFRIYLDRGTKRDARKTWIIERQFVPED